MSIPEVLMQHIDDYVDSLAPQIQPRISAEIEKFQQKTVDSLEGQVIDAFLSLFERDEEKKQEKRDGQRDLDDNPPDSYGGLSLPFADEIAELTRTVSRVADEAGDDLVSIFELSEGGGAGDGRGKRSRGGHGGGGDDDDGGGAGGFLSAAVNAVKDHFDGDGDGSSGFVLDGLLGILSDTIKDTTRDPEDKARLISPELKQKVGDKLAEQHAPIAERFTHIALDHIKLWLRHHVDIGDLGDGVKGEVHEQVDNLVSGIGDLLSGSRGDDGDDNDNEHHHSAREGGGGGRGRGGRGRGRGRGGRGGRGGGGARARGGPGGDDDDDEEGGFSKVISDKLSIGLAKVHRQVRLEFRKILGVIEKELFELLPDDIQGPLEKILGGNPFDPELDEHKKRRGGRREAEGEDDEGGFFDDIKAKLVEKIRDLVHKVQDALREGILGVVDGGHRKFEREAWNFVQNMVEHKVQEYLPDVDIYVPDDIGNERVKVNAPKRRPQRGGHH